MSLKYKGYVGHAAFDDEAGIFHGEVLGIRDVVTFAGKSVREIEKAFRESVDDYLEMCQEDGVEPNKPYSGQFRLRVGEDLHRNIAIVAEKTGKSLNDWIKEVLAREVSRVL